MDVAQGETSQAPLLNKLYVNKYISKAKQADISVQMHLIVAVRELFYSVAIFVPFMRF